jgi:hypothetical protein
LLIVDVAETAEHWNPLWQKRSAVSIAGTRPAPIRLHPWRVTSQLLEQSFQIAWEYLERTGELGDAALASRFLGDTSENMIRRGQRSW